MEIFKKGVTVKQLRTILEKLPDDKPFLVANDEEQNTIFKGVYIEHNESYVLIAGLSGCEIGE